MPLVEHLHQWSLYSEQKVKIMKNRIQSLNYSSYIVNVPLNIFEHSHIYILITDANEIQISNHKDSKQEQLNKTYLSVSCCYFNSCFQICLRLRFPDYKPSLSSRLIGSGPPF